MTQSPYPMLRDLLVKKRILLQCFYGSYVVGLSSVLPVTDVCCLDAGAELGQIQARSGIQFTTVERLGQSRDAWAGAGIDLVYTGCADRIARILGSRSREDWLVLSSPTSRYLQTFCEENGYHYVGSSPPLYERLRQKSEAQKCFREMGLPFLKQCWFSPEGLRYDELKQQFGNPFVVQLDCSAAGAGTRLISSEADLQHMADSLSGEAFLVSEYLSDLSFNINAAVIDGQVYVGFPSVQMSGVAELNAAWGGYCGNDYTSAAQGDQRLVLEIQDQTERIGEWLTACSFEGLYGLDFVISADDGRAYPVDLNPRWQGSTSLSLQAEIDQGRFPLAAAALLAGTGIQPPDELRKWKDRFREPVQGALLSLRADPRTDMVVTRSVMPGAYKINRALDLVRPAVNLFECAPEEALVTCGVPTRSTSIQRGSFLVRVQTHTAVSAGTSSKLSPEAARLVSNCYDLFGLEESPKDSTTTEVR